jgi:hypothetical protein
MYQWIVVQYQRLQVGQPSGLGRQSFQSVRTQIKEEQVRQVHEERTWN